MASKLELTDIKVTIEVEIDSCFVRAVLALRMVIVLYRAESDSPIQFDDEHKLVIAWGATPSAYSRLDLTFDVNNFCSKPNRAPEQRTIDNCFALTCTQLV